MAKTGRVEVRVEPELLARLDARCEVLGQTRTKFIERALESALAVQGHVTGAAETPAPTRATAAGRSSPGKDEGVKGLPEPSSPAASLKPRPKLPAGVRTAREFVLDPRQARLNKAKGS